MFEKTNLEKQLLKSRSRRISSDELMREVEQIFFENENKRDQIRENLSNFTPDSFNNFQTDWLDPNKIFHLEDIKKLCLDYRLRFLSSHFFKGDFPEEAITAIRVLEQKHQLELKNFKIAAPSKRLKLENADDPLLFAPLGNDYFYLVHRWGNDLIPLRKLLVWPFKNFENLLFTIFLFSILATAVFPIKLLSQNPTVSEYILLFLFIFKSFVGIGLYFGFAKGKNFNEVIWNSKYYNA